MTIHPWPKPEPKVKPPKVKKPRKPLTRKSRFLAGGNGAGSGKGRKVRKARKPVKRRNVKRHAKNLLRANGPVERRQWIKGLPSIVSGKGPCEAAHVRNGGTSRKADAKWTVPLTHHEHIHELHQWGQKSFEEFYGVDLISCAIETERRWQDYSRERIA